MTYLFLMALVASAPTTFMGVTAQDVQVHYETEQVPVTRNVTTYETQERTVKVQVPVTRQETVMVPRTVKVTTTRTYCDPCQQAVVYSNNCCSNVMTVRAAAPAPVYYRRALFQRRAARRAARRASRVATPQYLMACPGGQCSLSY